MYGYTFEILLVLVVIVKAIGVWEGYHSESLPITFLIPIFFSRPCFLLYWERRKCPQAPITVSTFLPFLPIYSVSYLFYPYTLLFTWSYKWVIFPSPLSSIAEYCCLSFSCSLFHYQFFSTLLPWNNFPSHPLTYFSAWYNCQLSLSSIIYAHFLLTPSN